ncbi:MAG: HIT family protein [Candidatus Omnitrophica bacterium]|nr:HIT family protein [Candidatus Omnitrophota bacterium]
MTTIFTKIIKGEIPCHQIAENEKYLAFLDVRPINPGHTLVIPKKEVDYLFDLDEDLLGGILLFAKPIAKAIKQVVDCKKIGVMVAGIEVPHAHVHLVPIQEVHDLNFSKARPVESAQLKEMAEKIRSYLHQ